MKDRREVAMRLAALDEVEVTVEKLVAGGDGLARVDGIPLFIARSAPGDRVRVRLVERRADYGRAEIVELLAPGPGRRPPPCPYFVDCGGCQLQHLEDALQVRYKARAVVRRFAGRGPEACATLEVIAARLGYGCARSCTPADAQGACRWATSRR